MKKALLVIVLGLAAIGAGAFYYRDRIELALALRAMRPTHSFAADTPSPAPDYASIGNWASLPDRDDPADVAPLPQFKNRQSVARVDVFFVHPTTYYRPDHWNQPLDDELANYLLDRSVLRNQASIFNSCCKIYAPRYRQATLASFLESDDDGREARELAYQDVLRAFDYFIQHDNAGRPFILAGHSQGSAHIVRLLKDRITGMPLKERLIAVYALGTTITRAELKAQAPDIPVCESPTALGCFITWNSVGPHVAKLRDSANDVCVNPLTWRTNAAYADRSLNDGGVSYPSDVVGPLAELRATHVEMNKEKPEIDIGIADAQCKDGRLLVTQIRSRYYTARPMGRDNYHTYDFALFHANLRENLDQRVAAYFKLHPLEAEAAAPAMPPANAYKPEDDLPGAD